MPSGMPSLPPEPWLRPSRFLEQERKSFSFLHCSSFLTQGTWVTEVSRQKTEVVTQPAGLAVVRKASAPALSESSLAGCSGGLERSTLSSPAITRLGIFPKELIPERKARPRAQGYLLQRHLSSLGVTRLWKPLGGLVSRHL